MPLYEYVCQACQREQELLLTATETPRCEQCGSERMSKLLSVPAAHCNGETGRPADPPAGSCGSGCGCFPG